MYKAYDLKSDMYGTTF
uniref:Uncharacterized protein n=1 Tax=Rhizophora mucronata TaxID=61149 RepID=A0A2P2Q9M7_RHIMU